MNNRNDEEVMVDEDEEENEQDEQCWGRLRETVIP